MSQANGRTTTLLVAEGENRRGARWTREPNSHQISTEKRYITPSVSQHATHSASWDLSPAFA